MNNTLRIVIATIVVALLVAGPFAWARQFKHSFRTALIKKIRDHATATGDKSFDGVQDDEISLSDFGLELSSAEMNRVWLADMLHFYWWLWGLIALSVGYGLWIVLGWTLPPSPAKSP